MGIKIVLAGLWLLLSVSCTSLPPLFKAVEKGDRENTVALLDEGAAVDTLDDRGRSPLFYATMAQHSELIELLVERGAVVDREDGLGKTPLIAASSRGKEDSLKKLIELGANVNYKSEKTGHTPLYHAVVALDLLAVNRLIEAGADPLEKKRSNDTLLHALSALNPEKYNVADTVAIIDKLLEKGVEIDSVNLNGYTPLALIVLRLYLEDREKFLSLVDHFIAKGADTSFVLPQGRPLKEYISL